jgi:hypothetical protein
MFGVCTAGASALVPKSLALTQAQQSVNQLFWFLKETATETSFPSSQVHLKIPLKFLFSLARNFNFFLFFSSQCVAQPM